MQDSRKKYAIVTAEDAEGAEKKIQEILNLKRQREFSFLR